MAAPGQPPDEADRKVLGRVDLPTLIGLLAGALTTASFVPQVVRILVTRETRAISLTMYALFTTGVFLWLVYGVILEELPIVLANGLAFVLAATVLALKLRHG